MNPQLSLFPNSNCTQCDQDIPKGHIYCDECAEDWAEKYLCVEKLE